MQYAGHYPLLLEEGKRCCSEFNLPLSGPYRFGGGLQAGKMLKRVQHDKGLLSLLPSGEGIINLLAFQLFNSSTKMRKASSFHPPTQYIYPLPLPFFRVEFHVI